MRLLRLKLVNFRSHADLDLRLDGVSSAAILGPNGAGKTSLLAAVEWGLYGTGGAETFLRDGAQRMAVTVEVEQGGARWRVARGRERKRGGWLTLDRLDADGEHSYSSRTVAETQARVVEHVTGLDADAFRSTVYAPQGEAGLLAALPPARRKELLSGLLGLERYDEWRQAAALEARDALSSAHSLAVERERLIGQLHAAEQAAGDAQALQDAVEAATTAVAEAEAAVDAALAAERAREGVRLRASLVAQMTALRERGKRSRKTAKRRAALQAQIDQGEGVRARFDAAERARTDFERRQAEARAQHAAAERDRLRLRRDHTAAAGEAQRLRRAEQAAAAELDRHGEQLAALDGRQPHCPTCKQTVADEALDAAREALAGRGEDLTAAHGAADEAAIAAEQRAEALGAEVAALPEASAVPEVDRGEYDPDAHADLRAQLAELDRLAGELAGLGDPEDLNALRDEWNELHARATALPRTAPDGPDPYDARAQLAQAQAQLRACEARRAAAAEQRQIAARLTEQRDELDERLPGLERRAQALGVLAGAFGRNGIPALVLDNATGAVEAHANEALRALGGQMRLRLATQRTTQSGSVAETLDIVVDDGVHERPLERFSGGERYRVHVALRLGLAEALAAAGGLRCDVLLLDEPTDLDEDGMVALGALLAAMPQQTLVVSHSDRLIEAMPASLRVARTSHGESTVTLS